MIRKRCVQRGHKWAVYSGVRLPFQFCLRSFCDGARVNPDYPMPPEVRVIFEQIVLQHMRLNQPEGER